MQIQKLTVKATGDLIPAGSYEAEFLGLEECEHDHKNYGPGICWRFRIVDGEVRDKVATRVTGNEPTKNNACGRMLSQVAGTSLEAGTSVELADYVGHRFHIQVVPTPSGAGTRVEVVVPSDGEC